MPNSPDPLFTEAEAEPLRPTQPPHSHRATPDTTIKELRLLFGPHFAPGYEDQDRLGHLLGLGGYASLDEYLARHHIQPLQPDRK